MQKRKKNAIFFKNREGGRKGCTLDLLRKRDLLSACFRLEHDKKKMQ